MNEVNPIMYTGATGIFPKGRPIVLGNYYGTRMEMLLPRIPWALRYVRHIREHGKMTEHSAGSRILNPIKPVPRLTRKSEAGS